MQGRVVQGPAYYWAASDQAGANFLRLFTGQEFFNGVGSENFKGPENLKGRILHGAKVRMTSRIPDTHWLSKSTQ